MLPLQTVSSFMHSCKRQTHIGGNVLEQEKGSSKFSRLFSSRTPVEDYLTINSVGGGLVRQKTIYFSLFCPHLQNRSTDVLLAVHTFGKGQKSGQIKQQTEIVASTLVEV